MDRNRLVNSNATTKIAAIQQITEISLTYQNKLSIDVNIFHKQELFEQVSVTLTVTC
jgi:hypothetical protein